jgi:hypothetical protein
VKTKQKLRDEVEDVEDGDMGGEVMKRAGAKYMLSD